MTKAIAFVLCAAGLSGCLTSNVLITVHPDGSGTVEQTVTIRPAAMGEFQRLASPELAANAQDPAEISRQLQKDFEKMAAAIRLGWNLRPRATRPINAGDSTGWAVTYDFDDITSVQLDLLPQMPGLHGFYRVAAKEAGASTALKATLEPISDVEERLTFHFPRFAMDQSGESPGAWASGSPQEMDAFRRLLKGSRVTMTVDSAAPIVRTNSPFRQQNRVTLLDVDVEQALFSKQIAMLASTPSTFEDLLSAFADLPGVALAHDLDITIDLENPSAQASAPPPQAPTQSPPDTEIYLASLFSKDGKLAVVAPPAHWIAPSSMRVKLLSV